MKPGDRVRLSAYGRSHFAWALSRPRGSRYELGGFVRRIGVGRMGGTFVDVVLEGNRSASRYAAPLWEVDDTRPPELERVALPTRPRVLKVTRDHVDHTMDEAHDELARRIAARCRARGR